MLFLTDHQSAASRRSIVVVVVGVVVGVGVGVPGRVC